MFAKYKTKILLGAVFGALIFLVFSVYADFDKLISAFGQFNWWWFPVILSLSALNYVSRFYKWHYYTKILGIEIKTSRSFLIYLSAFVMSVTPGKMGEVLKSYILKEETGTPVSKSAPILIAERLTDFISIIILCLLGAFVFDYGQIFIIISGVFFLSFTVLLSSRTISLKIISLSEKIKFVNKHIHRIHTAYDSIYQLIRIKPLVIATCISIISWFFECLGFYIVLMVFASYTHIDVSILTATFIYGFSTLVGAIAMLPGGLGATEATITGLLVFLKIPKNISVASTIIIRVATLWFAVFVGIIAVLIYQRVSHKNLEKLNTNADF